MNSISQQHSDIDTDGPSLTNTGTPPLPAQQATTCWGHTISPTERNAFPQGPLAVVGVVAPSDDCFGHVKPVTNRKDSVGNVDDNEDELAPNGEGIFRDVDDDEAKLLAEKSGNQVELSLGQSTGLENTKRNTGGINAASSCAVTAPILSSATPIQLEEQRDSLIVQAIHESAKDYINESKFLLGEITFDPKQVITLLENVKKTTGSIGRLLESDLLSSAIRMPLEEQRDHLIVKANMLSQYLEDDPFSDKNVLYPRRIFAEAAKWIIDAKLAKDLTGHSNLQSGVDVFDHWYKKEISAYETAASRTRSQSPEFYLNKKNPENPLMKYKSKYVVEQLKQLFSGTDFPVDGISEKEIQQAASTVMNMQLDWKTVKRDMVFSMGKKTGSYSQVSTPLSESKTAVGADLRKHDIRGIVPSVRNDGRAPINTRLTQLFKMDYVFNPHTGEREEKKVLLHERQQHGINDHFDIQDPKKRHAANLNSMKQLIQAGAEADRVFMEQAFQAVGQPAQLFYINTNLTTPTWMPRGNKNYEVGYSRHQGTVMRALEGDQTFSVLKPDHPEARVNVNLKVTCIDFRFPVNYAISSLSEDSRSIDPGMIFAWPKLRTHNEAEFKKLFGSLDAQAPIQGIMESIYQNLETKANGGNEDALNLQTEIKKQVEYVREMFRTKAYQQAGEDRFKMPRHIDLLVNALRQASELVDEHRVRVVNAGGCMSGKDREGVANAENEAAMIIQDLGGSVEPGQGGRFDDESQAIYDSVMTGVVRNTQQVTGIGGSKNAEEIASQMSDPHAKIYAQGGAKFVKS